MRRTSWFVFLSSLLTLLMRCIDGSDVALDFQNKVPLKLIWGIEGDDIELPCDLTPPTPNDKVSMVLWFKDDNGIPLYNLDARSRTLENAEHWTMSGSLGNRTYFQVDNGQRARLKVKSVTDSDQGVFRCRVDFVNSPTRNFRVNLTLIEQPTKPVIYDAQGREVTGVGGPFLEGYDLLLTCQVSGGKPKPSVTWWRDGELLDGVTDTPIVIGSTRKFTVNQLFISKVTRSLWGSKLECRAKSGTPDQAKEVIREIPLDIYLKPAVVKIVLADDQIFAGRPMSARCETWGSSPAARIVWRLGGLVIRDSSVTTTQRSNSTVSKIALVLGKDDDGKELGCRAENPRFPGGVLEETKVLRVLYVPTAVTQEAIGYNLDSLREEDEIKLSCNYHSNPPPTTIEWFHNNKRLVHSPASGILVASSTLSLIHLTLAQAGLYSCVVKNAIGEARSPPIDLQMKYAPRCKPGYEKQEVAAARRQTVLLRCEIEADPEDSVRFSWTFNNTLGDVFPMPNPQTSRKRLSSIFEYTPASDVDFGTFACWASNIVGRQRTPCIFNVVPAKVPQSPFDCALHNETSALEVNCIPGSSGGSPQHFLLEVRGSLKNPSLLQILQSDQGTAGEAPPIYEERNRHPSFQLHDLEPGYDYTIAVYAVNEQGKSLPVLLENIRVAEPIHRKIEKGSAFFDDLSRIIPQKTAENTIIVFGLIVTVALILIGIGVAIGLVICRRRTSSPPKQEGPDDFTTPSYVPAQRIEPRIRYGTDRRRPQRASLYIEENRNEPDLLQQVDIDLHH